MDTWTELNESIVHLQQHDMHADNIIDLVESKALMHLGRIIMLTTVHKLVLSRTVEPPSSQGNHGQ